MFAFNYLESIVVFYHIDQVRNTLSNRQVVARRLIIGPFWDRNAAAKGGSPKAEASHTDSKRGMGVCGGYAMTFEPDVRPS